MKRSLITITCVGALGALMATGGSLNAWATPDVESLGLMELNARAFRLLNHAGDTHWVIQHAYVLRANAYMDEIDRRIEEARAKGVSPRTGDPIITEELTLGPV